MFLTQTVKTKCYYHTDELRDLITRYEQAEEDLKHELLPFIRLMFKKFYDHRSLFSNTTSCVAELDCLCSLAAVSA
jgi:DNA mismatch repair ATPase MutS